MQNVNQGVSSFDPAVITQMARQASGHINLILDGWQSQPISGGAGTGTSIQRISGVGQAARESVSWRMIVKTINIDPMETVDPTTAHYPMREAFYYQSGLLSDLPGNLRAPRCFGVVEGLDRVHIFLESLEDIMHSSGLNDDWPAEQICAAASNLGNFNGAYLVKQQIPTAAWIPRRWLRAYVENAAQGMNQFLNNIDHPLIRRMSYGLSMDWLLQMWDNRHEVMDALERLPQVFSHQDAFCRNLFTEPDGKLVAVDWAFAGPAPVGAELVPLVIASAMFGCRSPEELGQLFGDAQESYLEGLSEAGWRGSSDLVRISFGLTALWRYPIAASIGEGTAIYLNETLHPETEQIFGMPIEQLADRAAVFTQSCLPFYHEALRLLKALNL